MTGFELNPLKTYVNIKQPKLKKGVQDFLFFNIPLSIKSSTVLLGHIIKIHVHKSPRKAKFNQKQSKTKENMNICFFVTKTQKC